MKPIQTISKGARAIRSRVQAFGSFVSGRGQAAVEFALVATVAMIVLFVAVQLALIGEDALALGQMNYQGARWAAVNTCATPAMVLQYMLYAGSPSVTMSGGSCGTQLSMVMIDTPNDASPGITVTGTTCTDPTSSINTACTNPRTFGTAITITLTFNASKAIFLAGSGGSVTKPWMGLINFPTTLTSTETAMSE